MEVLLEDARGGCANGGSACVATASMQKPLHGGRARTDSYAHGGRGSVCHHASDLGRADVVRALRRSTVMKTDCMPSHRALQPGRCSVLL